MNILNKTVIDLKIYTNFQLFRKMYIHRSALLNTMIYILGGILGAALLIFGLVINALVYILVGALILIVLIRLINDNYLKPKKMFANNKIRTTEVNYIFTKNAFRIPQEGADDSGHIKYDQLMKVYETKEIYYLYLQKNVCYLVSKQGFQNNDVDIFAQHLKEILGKRYIVCG